MGKPQLFMIHFAGGNLYSFDFMYVYLKEFQIEMLELPGRGTRSHESLITDFDSAANDIYSQVKNRLNSKDFLIYGHSMGAFLALRVTKMLEQDNLYPLSLIVTGNSGPKIKENIKRYLLNDQDFVHEIKKLGGLSVEFLESKELLDYFTPILKADFEISEENNLDNDSIVNVPIYAVMGDSEKHKEYITNWLKYTTSNFNYEILNGNHFFIYNHAERLSDILTKSYFDNKRIKTSKIATQ